MFDNRIGDNFSEGIMEDQYDKKVMVVASLSAIVGGGVYYFLVSPNIKENTVLTTKVNPTIESEVQGNIEEKKSNKLIMLAYLKN